MSRGNKPITLDVDGDGNETQFVDPTAATGSSGNGSGTDNGDGSIRDANGTEFDPERHIHPDTRNSDGSFRKRKRGRGKANQSRSSVRGDIKESAAMLTRGLMIFHTSIAALTKTPELVLDEAEASGLSESGLTLLSLYDIKPDPRVEAAILFAGQVGLVYGTRIVAIRARKSQEKAERRKGTAGMYDAAGNPIGTTEYRNEWPVGEQPNDGNGNIFN